MKREDILIEVIKSASRKLKETPSEKLQVKNQHGHLRYYQGSKYLKKDDVDLIRSLQEKAYYQELKEAAELELQSLVKIKKIKEKVQSFEQVFLNIPENRRNLITPFTSPEEEEVKKKIEKEFRFWKKEAFVRKGVDSKLQLVTSKGERVRSKSELIIADRLTNSGIPYYYEGQYVFTNEETWETEVWFPDFQVLNPRTGELFFWEHFGMLDNPEYCASCQFKLETYAKHGIMVGKNLIVSTESSQHILNVDYVDKLIDSFLK